MNARFIAHTREVLVRKRNPILQAFRHAWDGSAEHARRFRDDLDGWDEPTSIRDEAADFLDDLIATLARH